MDEELRKRKNEQRRARRSQCIDCGADKPRNGYPRCRSCSKKHLWQSPEFQEKQRAYRTDAGFVQKQRDAHVRVWADPEKRERQRQVQLESWADPELRERHSDTLKTAYSDPELRAAVMAKLDEYRRANWADPDYRAKMTETMRRIMLGKFAGMENVHLPYTWEWTEELREAIRERDGRKCVLCGTAEDGKRLSVHHIDYDKTNSLPENLIALCTSCHRRTNGNRTFYQFALSRRFRKPIQDWQHRVVMTAKGVPSVS